MADAVGTTVGALCGTSTVTTYVESTTGIAEGGRTGLTAFSVAMLFLLALFFSPLFLMIPSAATTSALVLVGVMMIRPITKLDFHDMSEALPCFVTILMMPFTASISEGIRCTTGCIKRLPLWHSPRVAAPMILPSSSQRGSISLRLSFGI